MTVRINKPALNLREKLAELDKPSGIVGEQILRSDTAEDAREALNLEEHLFEEFESTGIQDNATSTKVTIDDTGVDVTGTVTADGLTVEPDSGNTIVNIKGGGDNSYSYLRMTSKIGGTENYSDIYTDYNASFIFQHDNGNKLASFSRTGDVSFYEDTGTTAKMVWDASAERLGLNITNPYGLLHLRGDGTPAGGLVFDSAAQRGYLYQDGTETKFQIGSATGHWTWTNSVGERMRIDSSGNVGIGTDSPNSVLHISNSTPTITLTDSDASGINSIIGGSSGRLTFDADADNYGTGEIYFKQAGSERARLDSSGNLLVGTTSTAHQDGSSTEGFSYMNGGFAAVSRSVAPTLYLNRQGNDGDIAQFRKDGSTVGSIGVASGSVTLDGPSSNVGIRMGGVAILPRKVSADADAQTSLGTSGTRFKDLYLSGGVYLGGTGSANKLDDYEEGTFTPSLVIGATAYNASTVVRANYTKIGNVVRFEFNADFTGLPTPSLSSILYITGLPFTAWGTQPIIVSIGETYSDSNLFVSSKAQQVTGGLMEGNNRILLSDGDQAFVRGDSINTSGKLTLSGSYTTNS